MWLPALLVLAAVSLGGPAAMAQEWNEQGDAGDLPGSAQVTMGQGELVSISGSLASGWDVDMYCIKVIDEASFVASNCGSEVFDPQFFLFLTSGFGVVHRDDGPCGLQSTLTSMHVTANGDYLLAISPLDLDPLSPAGDEIWADEPFELERTPDGPGAPGPVASWGVEAGFGGTYQIVLEGVGYCLQPTPVQQTTLGGIKAIYRD